MPLRILSSEARGLGSSAAHWWMQRLTAIALIPFSIWFVFEIIMLKSTSYETLFQWLQSPIITVLLVIFIVTTFYHTQLGLQVIIEDYVRGKLKTVSLILINSLCILSAAAGILALLKIFL